MVYGVPQVNDLHIANVPLDVVLSWPALATDQPTHWARQLFLDYVGHIEGSLDRACWQEAISSGLVPRQG